MTSPSAGLYVISTPSLKRSKEYFEPLNFVCEEVDGGLHIYDSSMHFYVEEKSTVRPGLKFQVNDVQEFVQTSGLSFKEVNGEWLTTDNGVWIRVVDSPLPSVKADTKATSVLGTFAGISIETFDISQSMECYSKFGFTKTMGSEESGWVAMEREDGMGLSLMKYGSCPHLFFNPSLTYFNSGKNPEIIKELRQRNIPLAQEIDHFNDQGIVDNVILQEPGGTGIFVFND